MYVSQESTWSLLLNPTGWKCARCKKLSVKCFVKPLEENVKERGQIQKVVKPLRLKPPARYFLCVLGHNARGPRLKVITGDRAQCARKCVQPPLLQRINIPRFLLLLRRKEMHHEVTLHEGVLL